MASERFGECPFCGTEDRLTDEHIWDGWLHETQGAKMLLKGSHGERFPNMHTNILIEDDGRLSATETRAGHIHKLLPHVTVRVCGTCNNGWMSGLESSVKQSLGNYIFGSAEWLKLTREDIRHIALWSIKTVMAYYLTRSPIENPFTTTEYRRMANDRVPPNRCQVWLFNSHHHRAQVGLGVYSSYFTRSATIDEMANERNNYCIGYLAASCVVFVLVRTPPELPSPGGRHSDSQTAKEPRRTTNLANPALTVLSSRPNE